MTSFSESTTLQAWLRERLTSLGWTYVPGHELDRPAGSTFIERDLAAALVDLNPAIQADRARVNEVLPQLRAAALSAVSEGLVGANERMTTWLRGHRTMNFVGTNDYVPVRLIDFEEPGTNRLIVSDEVTFGSPGHLRRFDVVLWINGLPIVVGETKSPVHASVSWLDAAREVHDVYEREAAPFFASNLLSFATDGRELHYGAVGQPPELWLQWGSTVDPWDLNTGPRLSRSVDLLLSPSQILNILRDYVLFDRPNVGGRALFTKLIPRYPQVEAVEAIHARTLDSDGRQGLIWHHQGTGKTLLMAFAALRLLNDPAVGGATVLIVLDRLDLVEQTVRQFQTAGLPQLHVAQTKADLRRMLADGARGVIVTTIFRFDDAGFLNDRDGIVVLVDEAHRTQEGSLGDDLRKALPKARFFGLTGTPIARGDRNTFKHFGDARDPQRLLNRYTIERAIFDGACVPIHVESRLVDFHVDAAALDEAFESMALEEELSEEDREVLVERAGSVQAIVHHPDRIRAVCTDIVEHYLAKVAPLGLKAQVVAFDRALCAAYEEEITRLLAEHPKGERVETAVVMTVGASKGEPAEWRHEYALSRQQEATVKARFRDPADPLSILIVTAKLLTGFDAEIEGVMYLDKPLRHHTLFQAICRTNRRFTHPVTGQEKHYGLVVDYVGIGPQIAEALREADPERGGRRPVDVGELTEELDAALQQMLARFHDIDRSSRDFEALMAAQQRLATAEEREAFAAEFVKLQALWEFLAPSPGTDRREADYGWLAQVYESVQPFRPSNALLWQRLGAKTMDLVHGHVRDVRVTGTGLDDVIVDAETIETIRRLAPPPDGERGDELTVGEALDTIETRIRRRAVRSGGHRVYAALAERLERLRSHQVTRAAASIEFLKEILELAQQVVAVEAAGNAGTLDELVVADPHLGALTQIFREYAPADIPIAVANVVADIDAIVRQVRFSGWAQTQSGDRTVRREVRLVLRRYELPTTGELFDKAYAYIRENY